MNWEPPDYKSGLNEDPYLCVSVSPANRYSRKILFLNSLRVSHRTPAGELTFREVVGEYLERGTRWSEATAKKNVGTVNLLTEEFGDTAVSKITRHQIEGYLARRKDEGLSKASRNRYLCFAKVVLGKAEEWGYVRQNVAAGIKQESEGRELPRPYRPD